MKKKNKINYLNYHSFKKVISQKNINFLIYNFKKGISSRICLHKSINDKHQEMIILQKKYKFFPPKKNSKSDQTFLILKGKLLILIFDNKGKIKSKTLLHPKKTFLTRVKKNTYHCDVPLSNYSIHMETKNCIYNNKTNIFAKFKFEFNSKIIKGLN